MAKSSAALGHYNNENSCDDLKNLAEGSKRINPVTVASIPGFNDQKIQTNEKKGVGPTLRTAFCLMNNTMKITATQGVVSVAYKCQHDGATYLIICMLPSVDAETR